MKEKWRRIRGLSHYLISNFGRVWSKRRRVRSRFKTRRVGGQILKPYLDQGYFTAHASEDGKQRKITIHREVAIAFVPNPENKPEVNHKDCNKTNNYAGNLEWATDQEQTRHAWANGRCPYPKGSKHGMSKLTEADIPKIRKRIAKGEMLKDIAADFGVHPVTITNIKQGKRWGHVP